MAILAEWTSLLIGTVYLVLLLASSVCALEPTHHPGTAAGSTNNEAEISSSGILLDDNLPSTHKTIYDHLSEAKAAHDVEHEIEHGAAKKNVVLESGTLHADMETRSRFAEDANDILTTELEQARQKMEDVVATAADAPVDECLIDRVVVGVPTECKSAIGSREQDKKLASASETPQNQESPVAEASLDRPPENRGALSMFGSEKDSSAAVEVENEHVAETARIPVRYQESSHHTDGEKPGTVDEIGVENDLKKSPSPVESSARESHETVECAGDETPSGRGTTADSLSIETVDAGLAQTAEGIPVEDSFLGSFRSGVEPDEGPGEVPKRSDGWVDDDTTRSAIFLDSQDARSCDDAELEDNSEKDYEASVDESKDSGQKLETVTGESNNSRSGNGVYEHQSENRATDESRDESPSNLSVKKDTSQMAHRGVVDEVTDCGKMLSRGLSEKKPGESHCQLEGKTSATSQVSKDPQDSSAVVASVDTERNESNENAPLRSYYGEYHKRYCGVWGVLRSERTYADLKILHLLYQNLTHTEEVNATEYLQSLSTSQSMSSTSEDHDVVESEHWNGKEDATASDRGSSKLEAAQDEFVQGLDDIDKLFEGVDPPDELDVGATGSSMQEVLVGSGSRIVVKRLMVAFRAVRRTVLGAKDKIEAKIKSDARFRIRVEREDIVRQLKTVWKSAVSALRVIERAIEDVFDGEQGDLIDEELRDMELKMHQTKQSSSGGDR